MMHGYSPIALPDVDPELTDPQLAPTAADVVAFVVQQLQGAGRMISVTPESMDAATAHAELMLAALGTPTI